MKVAVLTFPGSNCDYDLYHAVKQVGGTPVWRWHRDRGLEGMDAVLLPGGFSYGDYLRAGALARFSPIMEDVKAFADRGGPVVGHDDTDSRGGRHASILPSPDLRRC